MDQRRNALMPEQGFQDKPNPNALMSDDPMAAYMGQRAKRHGDAAGGYRFERDLFGMGGLALGGMGAVVPSGIALFISLVNELKANGADDNQAQALAAQKMWGNTGLPGRPEGN
jgi:hypothetical protein